MAKAYCALVLFFLSSNIFAASCCGGGQSAASLMIADHAQEWTLSTMFRSDLGQTNNDGKSLMDDDQNKDHTWTQMLEYKRLFGSRFQANASLSSSQKKARRLGREENNSGLADFSVGFFYEAVTNYTYNPWLPRIFIGSKLITPFGENNFSSQKELRTDIRGSGFYRLDFPVIFVRESLKLSLTPQYFPDQKNLKATQAFSSAVSYTVSPHEVIDLTTSLQWSHLAKKEFKNQTLISSQFWEVSLSPSWMYTKNASVNLNYSDTTLLGKSRNSALYRSFSLGATWSELL